MNTKEFSVKIEAPKNVNLAFLNPHDIQAAFNNFFLQNPQILVRIFETLGKTILPYRIKESKIYLGRAKLPVCTNKGCTTTPVF